MSHGGLGVRFPSLEGQRSSSRTGADIIADSLSGVAPDLAGKARGSTTWRKEYVEFFSASTRASTSAKSAVQIAESGLRSTWDRLVWVAPDGAEEQISTWASRPYSDAPGSIDSTTVRGVRQRVNRVEVPYRGSVLHGAALVRQLEEWVRRGIVEPGFASAVQHVIDNPDWLAMPGHRVVLIGAAAAMGPLEALSQWGADVVAIDVPVTAVTDRIRKLARSGAGTVTMPLISGVVGASVASDLPALRPWLSGQWTGQDVPVLGTHAYADGAAHVEVNLAADVLAQDLLSARPEGVLAYLNTPTDSFLVPAEAMEQARQRATSLRWNGPAHRLAAVASGGRLFQPSYQRVDEDEVGRPWGLSDTLVDVQGPNYALAKRVQRWRAVTHQQAGGRVSSTVAPASWTRSVTKNRILASTYAGAAPFGIEIFQPDTARALMAAKLVADTFRDMPSPDAHPESVFLDAAHGGLWRQPFEPRTGLGVAAILGLPATVLRGHSGR